MTASFIRQRNPTAGDCNGLDLIHSDVQRLKGPIVKSWHASEGQEVTEWAISRKELVDVHKPSSLVNPHLSLWGFMELFYSAMIVDRSIPRAWDRVTFYALPCAILCKIASYKKQWRILLTRIRSWDSLKTRGEAILPIIAAKSKGVSMTQYQHFKTV